MDVEQPGLDDHLQDDINAEDILDDVLGGGDVIDDFHSLKGMVSGALGSLGYKFSILIVLLFNFTYTAYNAFARSTKTEISVVSFSDCSCNPNDRSFYSFTIFSFTALWGGFLLICALCNIRNFIKHRDIREDLSEQERLIPDKHFLLLKKEIKKLTTMVLSLNMKGLHSHKINSRNVNSAAIGILNYMKQFLVDSDSSDNFAFDKAFKLFRYTLAVIQFFLRLSIVPLLLVQWLDEYSWNCVVGLEKDYCKETTVGYTFDQSIVIFLLYTCVLLSIILGIFMKNMPVKLLLSNQNTSRSKWCLPFQINHTMFLTNVSFILIIALIYISVLSQLTYVAATEAERDINSGRTFNIDGKWFNRSISGGVSNSVLWKCSEESSSRNLKVFFLTLLTLLIIITILYGAISLVMAFFNYQKVKELINHYYDTQIQENSTQNGVSIFRIAMTLHNLFQQQTQSEVPQNEIENALPHHWSNAKLNAKNLCRWCSILFLIPAVEFILILILFLLVLTSYNVYPIGCFFNDVHYEESTSTVMLDLAQGVYIYQQVAVVTSITISLTLIFFKILHICLAVTHHNQIEGHAELHSPVTNSAYL